MARIILVAAAILATWAATTGAEAQGGGGAGTGFALTGLVGQPEAGRAQGGGYTQTSEFYGGSPPYVLDRHFYAPYVVKQR